MKNYFYFLIIIFSSVNSFYLPYIKKYNSLKMNNRNYSPFGRKYYEEYIKRLNEKNISINIKNNYENNDYENPEFTNFMSKFFGNNSLNNDNSDEEEMDEFQNFFDPNLMGSKNIKKIFILPEIKNHNDDDNNPNFKFRRDNKSGRKKSDNFEVINNWDINFNSIGGYDNIKKELMQCTDILLNHTKYQKYNVRIPKGLILEGPPGNGKTLIAKAFAGETNTSFIPVSGAQFQEKYVGVGSTRVRELFDLAKDNIPCIIFIDEIDALGRKRSNDGESSSSERDNTLNELLVKLDGFKSSSGIFLMGATNRADLLDPALLRPGRIDKRIYIGPPDSATRLSIINIHLKGKPYDKNISIKDLVDLTASLSGAQIENLLNEAMLNALRDNREIMQYSDIDTVINKIMVGWQPNEHQFSSDIIDRITIHEMGHAIVGLLSKHHSKVSKVIINLSAPTSPGYTMFESSTSSIYTRESLFEHLMILLAGRIAEEEFYDVSVTTGAINDFSEAFKLAEKMVTYYGMGKNIIYPSLSDRYKELIDDEVVNLINDANNVASFIVKNSRNLIKECAEILKKEKILKIDELNKIIDEKYPEIYDLKIEI